MDAKQKQKTLEKNYCLEFLDTCKKWSQYLNALSLKFFCLIFFSPSGEQPLQESQQKVRFEKLLLLTTVLVIQCTGRFILPSLLVRTQICCIPRTLNEQKHNPCEFRHRLQIRVKPQPASSPCHSLSPLTALSLLLLAGKKSLIFNSEKLLMELVNSTSQFILLSVYHLPTLSHNQCFCYLAAISSVTLHTFFILCTPFPSS